MTDRPIIGFDAKRIVSNGTGLGSYGRTLINDLSALDCHDLHLYAPTEGRSDLRSQIRLTGNVHFHYKQTADGRHAAPFWRTHGIIKDLLRDGIQIYHGLSGELPIGISKTGIKSVVTIHDLIFLRHPEFYHWIDTKIYAWKFHQAIQEADCIVAISERTRQDIIELGNVDERKIALIYQSFSPRFTPDARNAAQPSLSSGQDGTTLLASGVKRYILSVGSIETRKNVLLAVKALPYLPEDVCLVVVGRHTAYTDKVMTYAEAHGLSHRLHILHGVTDEQLPALYAGAEAFVYPSVYEGFGIPIIEAISCGLPVVACTGSCLEEAGGPDSLYVAPDDAQGMANALRQTLKGAPGRAQRIERSQAYIQRFKGNDVACQLADLYHRLL